MSVAAGIWSLKQASMTKRTESKYTVALTREGRREHRQQELAQVLSKWPGIRIIESCGRNAVTVMMPDSLCRKLQEELPFATVLPHRSLELFRTSVPCHTDGT